MYNLVYKNINKYINKVLDNVRIYNYTIQCEQPSSPYPPPFWAVRRYHSLPLKYL